MERWAVMASLALAGWRPNGTFKMVVESAGGDTMNED